MEAASPSCPRGADGASAEKIAAVLASPGVWCTLVALGIAVRCRQYVGCPSFWYDEAYLLLNIFERSYAELLGRVDYNLVIPPMFLWVLRWLYTIAGPSEWAMRLPAALAGMGALLLMVPLARRAVGSGWWVCGMGFCALSSHALMHSSEVRPYTCDLLLTEFVLLATCVFLSPAATRRGRAWSFVGLLVSVSFAPWLSFPSVFALAGSSLSLFAAALGRRDRKIWLGWLTLNGLMLLSILALWYFDARHLYYDGLREHWDSWQGFPQGSSPAAALRWIVGCLVSIGDYGTTSMGAPLVLLAILGVAALVRRSPPLAVLLVGPVAVALVAAFLRRYPLSDRTLLFATPCIWLLATIGLADLARRLPTRYSWATPALMAVLLAPSSVKFARAVVAVDAKVEYREAFAYVDQHRSSNDALWVLHPEVYQVYFGKEHAPLDGTIPAEQVLGAARGGRLWMVSLPENPRFVYCPELFQRLRSPEFVALDRQRVAGLEIVLYAPAGKPMGEADLTRK